MLLMPIAWTLSTGLPTEARIPRLWETSVRIVGGTSQGCQSGRADGVLPLSAARAHEGGLPLEIRIPGFWDSTVPVSITLRELHGHLPLHRQTREAKLWAEEKHEVHR